MTAGDAPQPGETPGAREPLLTVGSLGTVTTSIIVLLVAFGLPFTHAEQLAVLGVVGALAPFIVAAVGRGRVYSPATVRLLLQQQRNRKS